MKTAEDEWVDHPSDLQKSSQEENKLLESSKEEYGTTEPLQAGGKTKKETPFETVHIPVLIVLVRILSLVSVISLALMCLLQLLPVGNQASLQWIRNLLRTYLFVFSLACVPVELELEFMNNIIPVMQNWVVRGLFYSFLGLIGVEESTVTIREQDNDETFMWWQIFSAVGVHLSSFVLWIDSFLLIICGIVYNSYLGNAL